MGVNGNAAAVGGRLALACLGLALSLWTGPVLAGETVRFAYQDRAGSVLAQTALAQGYFEAAGVTVEPKIANNGPATAEALFTGAADLADMGDTAAVILAARQPDAVVLASHATGEGRHRLLVRADSPAASLADLRGKRIGVKKGTSTYGGLLAALERAGIPAEAVTIVDLPPPTLLEALAAGSIDAFAASEPTPSAAETKGARAIGDFAGLGNNYPLVLVARRATVEAKAEALQRFFTALARAEAYVAAHPEETAALLAAQTGLPPDVARAAMARHAYALRADDALRASLTQTAAFLVREGVIDKAPDMAAAVDGRFVAGAGK